MSSYTTIIDEIEKNDYNEFRYLMFMLPIILNAKTVVETGLGQGHSTRIFLASLSQLSGERTLHTYDLVDGPDKLAAKADIEGKHFPAKWELHIGDVRETGKEYNGGPIDLLYLDSDHAEAHVVKELEAFTPHLSEKAIVFTHDSWPSIQDYPHPNVTWKALHDWGAPRGWKDFLFKTPEGMTILVRER